MAGETSAVVAEKARQTVEKPGSGWLWTATGALLIAALVVAGLLVARRRRAAEDE